MSFIYYPSNIFLKNQGKGEKPTQQEIRNYDRLRRSICNEPCVIKNEDIVSPDEVYDSIINYKSYKREEKLSKLV